jgi:metal-responsive CopG/Arc/MetJ family transcriptional regulator
MHGVTAARKIKLSVTVDADVVERVDRAAREVPGATRSSIVEAWLRRGARAQAERELRDATIAYYEALTPAERAEDEQLSHALSRRARRLDVDGPSRKASRRAT